MRNFFKKITKRERKREGEINYSTKFKSLDLHADKKNYKKTRCVVQNLIDTKGKSYFDRKLTETLADL